MRETTAHPTFTPGYNLSDYEGFISDPNALTTLLFYDAPNDPWIPLFGNKMSFVTSLVGVSKENNRDWKPLYTFDWESNVHHFKLPIFGEVLNIIPDPNVIGGISNVVALDDPYKVPLDILTSWRANGLIEPSSTVSEPAPIALLVPALLALFFFNRKYGGSIGRQI